MLITPKSKSPFMAHLLTANVCMFIAMICILLIPATLYAAPEYGKICGTYFWDKNGNGVQETNEPGVSGSHINVFQQPGNAFVNSTSTGANGAYCLKISDVNPNSTYEVTASNANGWVPTFPLGPHDVVFSNISYNQVVFGIDFGARLQEMRHRKAGLAKNQAEPMPDAEQHDIVERDRSIIQSHWFSGGKQGMLVR